MNHDLSIVLLSSYDKHLTLIFAPVLHQEVIITVALTLTSLNGMPQSQQECDILFLLSSPTFTVFSFLLTLIYALELSYVLFLCIQSPSFYAK